MQIDGAKNTMHVEATISEPLEKAIDDWDFLEATVAKKFSTFRAVGANIYGVRRRVVDSDGITDVRKGNISAIFELGPDGPIKHAFRANNFHIIASGTPHHVPHSFGYWHINDMEELMVKFPGAEGDELGYSILLMRRPTGSEGESIAWYCEKCLTILYELRLRTGELGLGEFWRGERQAVHTYNADPKLQTCPECGHHNPLGYAWNTSKDTAEEAIARREGYGLAFLRN